MEIRSPSLAESIVPAVVGDTNLLWLNCCMISPPILIATPAMIMRDHSRETALQHDLDFIITQIQQIQWGNIFYTNE